MKGSGRVVPTTVGDCPRISTPEKTSARSSRAFFVFGVNFGGGVSSTSSSAPRWRIKSITDRGYARHQNALGRVWRNLGNLITSCLLSCVVAFSRSNRRTEKNLARGRYFWQTRQVRSPPRTYVSRVAPLAQAGRSLHYTLAFRLVAGLVGPDGTRMVASRDALRVTKRPQDFRGWA